MQTTLVRYLVSPLLFTLLVLASVPTALELLRDVDK